MLENDLIKLLEKKKDTTNNRGTLTGIQNHSRQRVNDTFIINLHNVFLEILLPRKLKANWDNPVLNHHASTLAKVLVKSPSHLPSLSLKRPP